ncbi:MAG TPA: hypothetical protein VFU43_13465 [Streptosporangiaceae bacterium]|nr:hypothetical protein [Streptosporangiaceae bacterium]
MTNRRGSRVISRVADFWGVFYLRPNGRFAGFSINLRLSGRPRSADLRSGRPGVRHRADQAGADPTGPTVLWEAVDLSHHGERDFAARGVLSNGRNEIFTDAVGKVVPATSPSSGRPYVKVRMSTHVRGLQLNWLQLGWPPKRYFFRQLQLSFFTELRQRVRA